MMEQIATAIKTANTLLESKYDAIKDQLSELPLEYQTITSCIQIAQVDEYFVNTKTIYPELTFVNDIGSEVIMGFNDLFIEKKKEIVDALIEYYKTYLLFKETQEKDNSITDWLEQGVGK